MAALFFFPVFLLTLGLAGAILDIIDHLTYND